ncbi:MAG: methyltransferase [Phormidesmis sp. CAN_BIN44]|nr:methyltransferase [Phormidesmis sp. CAN_BIN44]
MTETLLRSSGSSQSFSEKEVFFCPEESHFYSHCLERLVFNQCSNSDLVVEFGCGDGTPVINSLTRISFDGKIHGYELNPSACEIAQSRIAHYDISHQYSVCNQSFFENFRSDAQYLIANPPYIPAPDDNIAMPLLHGGTDGATITNRLLSLDHPNVMLLVSSYSNPVGTIAHALANDYSVADFMITPLKFGYYSSEPKVKNHISELRKSRKAFYSGNIYFLAGVLFKKRDISDIDLSTELIQVMTSL